VKRVLASFAGLVGIAALGRWLARRTHRPAAATGTATAPAETTVPATAPAEPDPAEELRRRLAEARGTDSESGPRPEPEAQPAAAEETLEERRARVHAKARAAIDAMGDEMGDDGTGAGGTAQ